MSRDQLMGIGQATTMPQSYEVDALRGLLIGTPAHLGLDAVVVVAATVTGVTLSSLLLPRLAR